MTPHKAYTMRDLLAEDACGWRELVHYDDDDVPMIYTIPLISYFPVIGMWLRAFGQQVKRYPEFLQNLASKSAEEQDEFWNAVDEYSKLSENPDADKHMYNAGWLHVMDEAADAVNTAMARYMVGAKLTNVLDLPETIFLDQVEGKVDFIADLVPNLSDDDLQDLLLAIVLMSAAKLRITELRPHARSKS